MGIRYDAEQVAEFIDGWSHAHEGYKINADVLAEQYRKYCDNETFIGQAAEASKLFVSDKQMNLHDENLEIQKKLLLRYRIIEEDFKGMVDSSPKARIDTDVLRENRDHFDRQFEKLDHEGAEIEKISQYVIEKFGKYNSNITRTSYTRSRKSYEEDADFCDECKRKVEKFDELSLASAKKSGLEEQNYDLQKCLTATTSALNKMQVSDPKMETSVVNLLATGGAPKAMKMGGVTAQSNAVLLNVSDGFAIPMEPEVWYGLEETVKTILEVGKYTMQQIEAVIAQLPALATLVVGDGPLPIGDLIAAGILAADATLIVIKTAEFLRAYNFSKSKGKSKTKSKSKGKDKNQEKPHRKNKDGEPLGKNGTKMDPKTIWQRGKTERVDVENPKPGDGNGNVHYHDAKDGKYIFDPVDGKLYYDDPPYPEAPPSIQRMLEDPAIQRAIDKALKYLGEPPFFK
ncbi:hypothetical protein [Butyrivibrio sp. INlla21]|uniref:hypothetical protein n=1 Tax=Butyrivibrio sp. INlla21 TaxID=1520811 RepID=UPI0008EAC8EE|nr:hypothetical protein [Butyrivibrio sp. INlla21]SFU59764.1 hypothetical protein SAMN02910342_01073 [Butyrivibrio sp. INlla21]